MAVPTGLIVIWRGSISPPPSNWLVCDGTSGTPDLREKFIRGNPEGGTKGASVGADSHNHTTQPAGVHTHTPSAHSSHTHTSSTDGDHVHGGQVAASGSAELISCVSEGGHSHTSGSGTAGNHSDLTADSDHTHTIDAADQKPPYWEVAFLQSNGSAEIVSGIIIIWTGTISSPNTVPTGWDLVSDFYGKFIRGHREGQAFTTGGNADHTHTIQDRSTHSHGGTLAAESSTHTHAVSGNWPSHDHYAGANSSSGGSDFEKFNAVSSSMDHGNAGSGTAGAHTIGADGLHAHTLTGNISNNPQHCTVAFIVANGASTIPANGVLWTIGTIPSGYVEVTELRGKLVKGVANSSTNPDLNSAGVANHTHTESGNAGGHNSHSIDSPTHTHTATSTAGAHTHTIATYAGWYGTGKTAQTAATSAGGHSHTLLNTGTGHTHTLGSAAGAHNHNTWGDYDSLPASVNVVFIKYEAIEELIAGYDGQTFRNVNDLINYTGQSFRQVLLFDSYLSATMRLITYTTDYVGITWRTLTSLINYVGNTNRVVNILSSLIGSSVRNIRNAISYSAGTNRVVSDIITYVGSTIRGILNIATFTGSTLRKVDKYANYVGETFRKIGKLGTYAGETYRIVRKYADYIGKTYRRISKYASYSGETYRIIKLLTQYFSETLRKISSYSSYFGETSRRTWLSTQYYAETLRKVGGLANYIGKSRRIIGSALQYIGETLRNIYATAFIGDKTLRVLARNLSYDGSTLRVVEDNLPVAGALSAVFITGNSARIRGKILDDKGYNCEARFRWRKLGDGWTETDWQNSLQTDSEYYKDLSGLEADNTYEFQTQARGMSVK